jgi:hypothetical protein
MRIVKCSLVALAAALILAPGVAMSATVGAEVFGALNTYAMEDVNDAADAANALGANFDEVSNGMTGGLGVRIWANPNWMLTAAWEPLFLETESSATQDTWNLDANSFQFGAAYFFPSTSPTFKYGLGAGLGIYQIGGELSNPTATPSSVDVEGSGVGFHFMGQSEWTVSPNFSITAAGGYRVADIEVDNSTGTADYSGFIGRVGMAFYMPTAR